MLSNLAVVGEAKRRHISDVGLPLLYSTQTQTLKILPEDVQACQYLLLCESERIETVTDFMLKGLKFPHWRQLFGNCSFLCCGCFTSPQCSKQDTQWHHSVSQQK